ncbi:MAG: xanthine dehydrogenase family protein subunit M, partial [Rhodobacteraceae bacterium]
MSFVLSPRTVEEAVGLLAELPDALPMSGGASLVAMKNARLIEASHFVSLAGIASLHGITATDAGLRIGGMTRHAQLAACDLLTGDLEMLRQAAGQIANRVVRNMGTIGGAVGNADPAADYLPVLACADAHVELTGTAGSRLVA